ncbi:MAG: acyltransferase family protein [Clostridia bacterium]|nr:acyltransferase family protein [Clostridia bacterium]
MANNRIFKWDNAKALLIFLVVFGHCAEPFTAEGFAPVFKSIFFIIYTFHMPAFIFISGLFSKHTVNEEHFAWQKLLPFPVMAFILKLFYSAKDVWQEKSLSAANLSVFSNIVWFLFVLFVFYALMYLLKHVNPKLVLVFSVVFACVCGYDKHINDVFALSRIIVYFPFFAAGYYVSEQKLREKLGTKKIKLAGAAVWLIFIVVCVLFINELYAFRPLITGRNPYEKLGQYAYFGGALRLAYYGICALLLAGFFSLVPNRKIRFAQYIGQHTLSIYFWHLPLVELLFDTGIAYRLQEHLRTAFLLPVLLLIALALCALLASPPFNYPLKLIRKGVETLWKKLN